MLFAFSGFKNSGKDTAAKVLIEEYGFIKVAFADALREALLILDPWISYTEPRLNIPATARLSTIIASQGWDWAKNKVSEVRRLMQVFGTEVGRTLLGEDVWVDILAKKIPDVRNPESRYVITDCRFLNEAQFVHTNLGDVCWITRPDVTSDGHKSESDEIIDVADYYFANDSTIEELQEDIRFLMFIKGVDPIESRTARQIN